MGIFSFQIILRQNDYLLYFLNSDSLSKFSLLNFKSSFLDFGLGIIAVYIDEGVRMDDSEIYAIIKSINL